VLRDGVLQQVDTPQRLFRRPGNLFVAAFIGSPSMNLVDAQIDGDSVSFAGFTVALPDGARPVGRDGPVVLGIRPTDFGHGASAEAGLPRIRVTPDVVEDLGSETHVIFTVDAPRVSADAVRAATEAQPGDEVALFAEDRSIFTAVLDARRPVVANTEVDLAVDPALFHFFDPETGLALESGERRPVAVGG
jgi:multiple sugar transport system ATP-binding protein